jgi:hypothetical protein
VAVRADIDRVLAQMFAWPDEGQRDTIKDVVVLLCRKGNSAKPVLDALAKADARQRPLLLATLARIGGPDALPAVMRTSTRPTPPPRMPPFEPWPIGTAPKRLSRW